MDKPGAPRHPAAFAHGGGWFRGDGGGPGVEVGGALDVQIADQVRIGAHGAYSEGWIQPYRRSSALPVFDMHTSYRPRAPCAPSLRQTCRTPRQALRNLRTP